MILLIDNYDSFSYNLYQLIGSIYVDIKVIRNDAMTIDEIEALKPEGIILSPGPGRPEDAGICIDVVKELGGKIPILGVCLGHQSICKAYGAEVSYAKQLMHGKVSECDVDNTEVIFKGLPSRIKVGRYHSLAAVEETMPESLKVIARTDDGEIMAVVARPGRADAGTFAGNEAEATVTGLQFHPESILTPDGKVMLRNWLESVVKQEADYVI